MRRLTVAGWIAVVVGIGLGCVGGWWAVDLWFRVIARWIGYK